MEKRAQDRPVPAHEQTYLAMRDAVLFGDLVPGQPVTIQGLCDALGAGSTPVREAIRRLISENALELRGNRRVCVPELEAGDLADLLSARLWVEAELCRKSLRHMTDVDIGALSRIDAEVDAAIARGDLQGYLRSNHAFHHHIHHLAASPILSSVADTLWLRFGPSMRVVVGRLGTLGLPDNHKLLIDALRSGDEAGAVAAMHEDVAQGMALIDTALVAVR
ncbi:GntR family transcriptional regulator [Poseidonocella sedimentorum]|uniref:DNA-binding transcriptional regulator, GntR family n=1 Tax=Poseidonocella sedimentorum TaxID=871652 RepID=A0A1I6D8N7_9RHOB|nr:GntR family transcriptional regulator [Poseidonocella sedimentorum]SFR01702.1 DNA-binding transcriptional regulator, GntR family [Poseidonocella sedimentorum]